jgi:hypothetical protein
MEDWLLKVQVDSNLSLVPLTREERCGHLTQVFRDLVARLGEALPFGSKGPLSASAANHGITRRRQGYSAAMMVEESHILQVCIFHTLQKNLVNIDFSVLLTQVMTITDEVDSQLRQAMECYVEWSIFDTSPAQIRSAYRHI